MTKAEIVERVYERVGFSKKEAVDIVELVFDLMKETLETGTRRSRSPDLVTSSSKRKGHAGEEILRQAKRSRSLPGGY